jgi:hypothetical protein
MAKCRQMIVWICISLLFCPVIKAQDVVEIQRRAAAIGQGADIKLKLIDGNRHRGVVDRIGPHWIDLRESPNHPVRSIEYAQIASLEIARRVYRSHTERDPIAAYRVALALGPDHHVLTRVRSGKTYRGHIQDIDLRGLTLRLDRTANSVTIPYEEIDHLEQNLSRLAKIAIVAGIGLGVCTAIWLRIVTDPNY